MSKKSRGPNFTSSEKETLIHLIYKYKDIVENKKTDGVTTGLKNEAWSKLTKEFNATSSFHIRNIEQLKTCWDNIKRNTKKDNAATKEKILLTGGGKPDLPPSQSLQSQVEVLLDPTLAGLKNEFDSDAQFSEQLMANINDVDENIDVPDPLENETSGLLKPPGDECNNAVSENKEKKVWSRWSPASLKTKMSDTLALKRKDPSSIQGPSSSSSWIHRRRPKTSLHDKLLQSKLELVEKMKRNAEIEAEIKLKILEEQLKQEKLKTETLELQLHKIKNE